MRARITRAIKVSEWCPLAQCPAYAIVLVLSRTLARRVNERWTKEQRSQPKRPCNLDQQRKTPDLLIIKDVARSHFLFLGWLGRGGPC